MTQYKRRHHWHMRWSRVRDGAKETTYYDELWVAHELPDSCALRVGQQWFVSPLIASLPRDLDIGPYPSMDDAICAAETMDGLGATPQTFNPE